MSLLKYFEVIVPYYIPIAIVGLLTGAILTTKSLPDFRIIYAILSLTFLVGGFNTLNGVYDKYIDSVNKPHRPIAKGTISLRAGLTYSIILYILALFSGLFLNPIFIAILLVSIILTVFYSLPRIRLRSKFIINTLTGLIFYGFLCPLAGWALYPENPIPIEMIIFLFILGSGIAITKDFEDVRGDRMYNVRTLPTILGIERTSLLTKFLITSSFVYMGWISLTNIVDIRYLGIFIFIPWALYTIYSLGSEKVNNNRMFFIKNILLAISIELFIIAVTLVY